MLSLKRFFTPALVVALFMLGYLGVILARGGGDPLTFARLGEGFVNGVPVDPASHAGYDGQFAYYIALDPRPAAVIPHLDVPAYRYQRVLYPRLARLLAWGQPVLIPWTLVLINLVALVAGTALVERWLVLHSVSRWYALIYGLWIGVVSAVRVDVSEPLCYALVMAAMLADHRGRRWLAALCLALAMLSKETAVLFVVALLASAVCAAGGRGPARLKAWTAALAPYVLSLAPFAVLQLLLYRWFGAWGLGSGGYMATSFEVIPYTGLWRVGVSNAFALSTVLTFGLLVVAPSVWGIVAALQRLFKKDFSPAVWALAASAGFIPLTPFSTFREAGGILRLATGLVLAVLLFGAQRRSKRVLNYSWVWLAGLAFIFKETLP
jgi:hypothetical protein